MNVPTSDLTFGIPPPAFYCSEVVTAGVTVSYEVLCTCIQQMLIETDVQLQ